MSAPFNSPKSGNEWSTSAENEGPRSIPDPPPPWSFLHLLEFSVQGIRFDSLKAVVDTASRYHFLAWPMRTPILGEINRTAVWAQDWTPDAGPGDSTTVGLGPRQIIALCLLSGRFDFGDACRPGVHTVESNSLSLHFMRTGETGGHLNAASTADGIMMGFDLETIRGCLANTRPGLHGTLRDFLYDPEAKAGFAREIHRIPLLSWMTECRNPPVVPAAKPLWFEGKIREFIALSCFNEQGTGGEFFCSRQKELAHSRVNRVKQYLSHHLDEALDLPALARVVGCSSHYLSRTFSDFTGTTISQHLRRLRIERAADLLSSGRFNVSEAAIEVGYQSLSHFSKAFHQEKGCLPSKYDRTAA
jgi:AraC-like DNA-binding protein